VTPETAISNHVFRVHCSFKQKISNLKALKTPHRHINNIKNLILKSPTEVSVKTTVKNFTTIL